MTIMSASKDNYMKGVTDPSDQLANAAGLTAGVQDAFIFGLILACIGLVLSLFIKKANNE